jgi:hypothetical protein
MSKKPKITLSEIWGFVDFRKFSTWSLIFSNLAVIFFAIIDKLSAIDVLWIYWAQSVIIGIFNFVKMLSLKEFSTKGFKQGNKEVLPTKAAKISTAFFFLFHYGFFHFIYAIFLGSFSSFGILHSHSLNLNYFYYSSILFFINYLVEFINSYREPVTEIPNLGRIMFAPYARIIPMHLTIIFGGFILSGGSIFSSDTNLTIIILFTGIKTAVDMITHSANIFSLAKVEAKESV